MPRVLHFDKRGRYSRWGRYCYPLSNRDWKEQRRNIEKTYRCGDRSLHQLVKWMREDYGFQATKRQYIIKLTAWGVLDDLERSRQIRCLSPTAEDITWETSEDAMNDDSAQDHATTSSLPPQWTQFQNLGDPRDTPLEHQLNREETFDPAGHSWRCPHPGCTQEGFDRFGDLEMHHLDHVPHTDSNGNTSTPAGDHLVDGAEVTNEEPTVDTSSNDRASSGSTGSQYFNMSDQEFQRWIQWCANFSVWAPQIPVSDKIVPHEPVSVGDDNVPLFSPLIGTNGDELLDDLLSYSPGPDVQDVAEAMLSLPQETDVDPQQPQRPQQTSLPSSSSPPSISEEDNPSPAAPTKPSSNPPTKGPHICDRPTPVTGTACNTVFSRAYDLKRHHKAVHNNSNSNSNNKNNDGGATDPPKIKCVLCVKEPTFKRRDDFLKHLRRKHRDVDSMTVRKAKG